MVLEYPPTCRSHESLQPSDEKAFRQIDPKSKFQPIVADLLDLASTFVVCVILCVVYDV